MSVPGLSMELRRAVLEGDVEATQLLLSRNADPNAVAAAQDSNETLLHLAVRQDSEPICRLLLVYQADPSVSFQSEAQSPSASLTGAWHRGDVAIVLETLAASVRVAAASHDVILLGFACALLEVAGADVAEYASRPAADGCSPLHLCAAKAPAGERGEAAARLTARTLLGFGCSVNAREAPLLVAIQARAGRSADTRRSAVEPARALLEAAAAVEYIDATGMTPIILAVTLGDVEACQLLIDFGADPWILSPIHGQSAIDVAAGKPELLAPLRKSQLGLRPVMEPMTPEGLDISKRTRSGSLLFVMNRDEDEAVEGFVSTEGLMNQVDLEESYESDWSPAHSLNAPFNERSCSTQAGKGYAYPGETVDSPPRQDAKSLLSHMVAH